jgi:hypothetical protein
MITVCSVLCGEKMDAYVDVFCDTLVRQTKLVDEVIFVKVDAADGIIKEWTKEHIRFKLVGHLFNKGFNENVDVRWFQMVAGHAYGIHHALEHATNDLVWMLDPDQFFFTAVDVIFHNLMMKYEIDIIGVSHFNPVDQSYLDFPCIINCMCRKSFLPPPSWLSGELFIWSDMWDRPNCHIVQPAEGKWLVAGPMPNHYHKFPNPKGIFDAGCNLWLWNDERKGRWMGFYLDVWLDSFKNNFGCAEIVYPLNYNSQNYKTNFGLQEKLGNMDLIYHRTRGGKEQADSFTKLYWSLFPK